MLSFLSVGYGLSHMGVMFPGDGWLICTVQTGRVWESSWFVLFHHVVFVVIIIVGFCLI